MGVPAVVFAAPPQPESDAEVEAARSGVAAVEDLAPGPPVSQRRQEILRQMVRDDYRRSGSTTAWSRSEQRAAYLRAEERLDHEEMQRDREGGTVSRLEDFVANRDHG